MQNAMRMQSYTLLRMVLQNNKRKFFYHLVFSMLKLCHPVWILIYFDIIETRRSMFESYAYDLKREHKLVSQWNEFKYELVYLCRK